MIPFRNFFNDWLYGQNGYYTQDLDIGKKGDFYTSVTASRYFGGSIASYLIDRINSGSLPEDVMVVEVGAHHGYLTTDVIQFIGDLAPNLLDSLSFTIVEPFESLRQIQQQYFQKTLGNEQSIRQVENLSELKGESAFILANEIFDAFGCDLIQDGKQAFVEDYTLFWDKPEEELVQMSQELNIQKGEISRGYENFADKLSQSFQHAEFITFDYGDLEPRQDFSIRIYSQHEIFSPFEIDLSKHFKKSDITYDVNFSHLIEAFRKAGFNKKRFTTQMIAMKEFGLFQLLETLQKQLSYSEYLQEIGKVKTLIHPSFMGERFKMVNFTLGLTN